MIPNPGNLNITNLVDGNPMYSQLSQLKDTNIQPVLEALQEDRKPSQDETSTLPFKAKVLLQYWYQLNVRD